MSRTSLEKIVDTIKIGTGGDTNYHTIQSALDNNNSGSEVFLVYPGAYLNDTINFTANNQSIIGVGSSTSAVFLLTNTTFCDVDDYTGCVVKNLTAVLNNTTTAIPLILANDGGVIFDNCIMSIANTDDIATSAQPSIVHITGTGEIGFLQRCVLNYDNEGSEATAIKAAFIIDGDGYVSMADSALNIDCTDDDTNPAAVVTVCSFGGIGEFSANNCSIDIDDDRSVIVAGGYSVAGINRFECNNCDIQIDSNGGDIVTVAAFYANSAAACTMYSYNNTIAVYNTTTTTQAYSYYQNNTGVITSRGDYIESSSGFIGDISFHDFTIQDLDSDTDDVMVTEIPDTAYGLIMVRESVGTEACLYMIAAGTIEKISSDATFTVTKDNAATYNTYFEDNVIKVQNKVGDNKNIRVKLIINNES